MAKPAVFLDRDGVINIDHGYVSDEHDFEYVEGVFEATKKVTRYGLHARTGNEPVWDRSWYVLRRPLFVSNSMDGLELLR